MQDAVFVCRKCEHHLFIEINDDFVRILKKLPKYECPSCGELGELNWSFSHIGKSEDEKDNFDWINE